MDYIRSEKGCGCIFCDKPREREDKKNLILHRGRTCYIIMNRYPYNNGHLLVLPYRHLSEFDLLSADERLELMDLLSLCTRVLGVFDPDGFNIGMNIGSVAGAGIEDHLHFHVVPRWEGDNNFMPVIGDVRVIPEYLEKTYEKLEESLKTTLKGAS